MSRIRGFVAGLVQRERLLLLLRVAGRTAAGAALLVCVAAWGAWRNVDQASLAFVLVLLIGVGGWLAVVWPLLDEWTSSGDPLRQARRVEALAPELRGRLVTSVEALRGEARPDATSDALVGLVLHRASVVVRGIPPARVHRATPALVTFGLAGAAWFLALVSVLVVGPGQVFGAWFARSVASDAMPTAMDVAEVESARVGDLVVTYHYPDYTGLEPKVVPNGTGDVEAPPGTRVEITARSAEPAEAAGIVAYGESLEAVVAAEGRTVSGQFTVAKDPGAWHFVVYRQGTPEQSRDFEIRPQTDLPPDVTLSVGEVEVLEVPLDGRFGLEWQARDDYGVRKVVVAIDGKETDAILDRPEKRRAELQGTAELSPRDLGLQAGDTVRLSVVAWDNDTVSGSKRGESRSIELVVLGANGVQRQLDARREELVEAMIPILARFLTEPWPPGDTGGEVATWGEEVSSRYQPLADVVEGAFDALANGRTEEVVVQRVLETGRALVRYTQIAFEPGSDAAPPDDSFKMAASLRNDATVALEDAILALVQLKHNAALGRIAEQADQLEQAAERLEQALARENPDAQELLSQLDQLERMMEQMAKEAAKLRDGGLREFVQSRESEIDNLMEEIRKAIAEGRTEEAREMMERLSELLKEMGEGIRQQMEATQQDSDDAAQEAESLQKELEALEQEQRQLQSDVQELQEKDQTAKQTADLWAQLEQKAEQHRAAADRFATGLGDAGRAFFEQERAGAGADAAEALQRAIEARDVRGGRGAIDEGQLSWAIELRAMEAERARRGQLPGPGARELGDLQRQLAEIEKLLNQLEEQSSQMSPETRAKSQELEDRQRDLQNRTQQASERAESLEQQFPVRPRGLQEAMQEAKERMGQASEDLSEGRPMQAEGSQGMAAQRLKEAADALQQARDQAQDQARQMQQGQQGEGQGQQQKGEGEGKNDQGQGNQFDRQELEIPGREEFRTPEEYRRALLEGMEGEVPEEYRAMKRRYFEELVSQ